jgi:hypothetical protein
MYDFTKKWRFQDIQGNLEDRLSNTRYLERLENLVKQLYPAEAPSEDKIKKDPDAKDKYKEQIAKQKQLLEQLNKATKGELARDETKKLYGDLYGKSTSLRAAVNLEMFNEMMTIEKDPTFQSEVATVEYWKNFLNNKPNILKFLVFNGLYIIFYIFNREKEYLLNERYHTFTRNMVLLGTFCIYIIIVQGFLDLRFEAAENLILISVISLSLCSLIYEGSKHMGLDTKRLLDDDFISLMESERLMHIMANMLNGVLIFYALFD